MLLDLKGVEAYYGKSHILHGVDMQIGEGEIVALLGRNGSGRSTTVKTIMGLVHGEGSIKLRGEEILGQRTFDIAHRGIGYVPENRDIFPKLTVSQNLQLGEKKGKKSPRWSFDDMYRLFPRLKERRAQTARKYLIDHGIDAARIEISSNGEERPVCQEHDESCWKQNRRDEFVIIAGGDRLVAPR